MDASGTTIGGTLALPDLVQWALLFFKAPRAYFRAMEKKGGYLTPCLFAGAWLLASGVISFLVSFLRPGPVGVSRAVQAGGILLAPLLGVAFGFIIAAVFFVIWHLMGSKEDYETAFRVWAFMAPLTVVSAVLGLIPFLNVLVFIYGFYLLALASQEVHGLTARKSMAVWGGLGLLSLTFILFAFVAGMAMRAKGGVGPAGGSPYLSGVQ